jgi:hypothetical protein
MSEARTHRRENVGRVIRTAKEGSAREAIGELSPGCEVLVLTYGQFSLIDGIVALLKQAGPADVILSTWTAGDTDLTTAASLLESSAITSLRMIVDRSFLTRQPGYCAKMRQLFGDECIRTMRSHAKFAVIRNERWTLAVRTSMNLNTNPRLEQMEISDDPGLADFLTTVADDLWVEQEPGAFDGELPLLTSLINVDRPGKVTGVGAVTI